MGHRVFYPILSYMTIINKADNHRGKEAYVGNKSNRKMKEVSYRCLVIVLDDLTCSNKLMNSD